MAEIKIAKLERREFEAVENFDFSDAMLPADEFDETGTPRDLVDLFN